MSGRRYVVEGTNARSIEAVTLHSNAADGKTSITFRIAGRDAQIRAAAGAWEKGTLVVEGREEPIAASGGWTASDTYTLKVVRYRTPFVTSYTLTYARTEVAVNAEQNVGSTESRVTRFVGRIAAGDSPPSRTPGRRGGGRQP